MADSVVKNATCFACGCTCDDIEFHVENNRVVRAENACSLGRAWVSNHNAEVVAPEAIVAGAPTTTAAGVAAAAEVLARAKMPLVYGFGSSTCEAQSAAVWLTETIGGVIDSHTSLTHGPTKTAAQLVGKVTCSLGEVMNRADLIIYWGTNPAESHPRHFSKYTLEPRGKFTPGGRADRTMVLVDVRETPSAGDADVFLQIRPGRDFEALTALRALVQGRAVSAELVAETGLSVPQLRDLVDRMKRARFGVLFFGTGLTTTRGKHMNAAAALTLAADLNAFTKFAVIPMRDHGNESGIDYVLSWTTGYPLGVDFSRGYPRSNPGEFTAVDLLVRRDVDAAVVVGDGPWALLPRVAVDHLARIPTIVINSNVTWLSKLARVHLTAAPATSESGTVYRMDKVPMALRPALQSRYPSEVELLGRIREAVSAASPLQ